MQGIVAAGSILTLANIELGSRPVNPDAGSGSACVGKCVAMARSCASTGIDPAARAEVVESINSGPENVPAPGEVETAEAWQPMQLTLIGPFSGNCASAHPVVVEAAAGAGPITSVPTTDQYHPSHQRLESLTIPLQNWM